MHRFYPPFILETSHSSLCQPWIGWRRAWNRFLCRLARKPTLSKSSETGQWVSTRICTLKIQNILYTLNFCTWGPPTFRTHEIFVQPSTAADSLTGFELLYAFNLATMFEMYENKLHTKYSRFTVLWELLKRSWSIEFATLFILEHHSTVNWKKVQKSRLSWLACVCRKSKCTILLSFSPFAFLLFLLCIA